MPRVKKLHGGNVVKEKNGGIRSTAERERERERERDLSQMVAPQENHKTRVYIIPINSVGRKSKRNDAQKTVNREFPGKTAR